MSKPSDQYRKADNVPEYPFQLDGAWYTDLESLIQVGLLGFCGCGDLALNLKYILAGLEFISEDRPGDHRYEAWYRGHEARCRAHFGPEAGEWFFYYWTAAAGLTEHGSCLPGWLTEKGSHILALLREWKDAV